MPLPEPDEEEKPYLFDPEELGGASSRRSRRAAHDRGDRRRGGRKYPKPAARSGRSIPSPASTCRSWLRRGSASASRSSSRRCRSGETIPCDRSRASHHVRRRHLQQLPDPLLRLALSLAADVRSRSPAVARRVSDSSRCQTTRACRASRGDRRHEDLLAAPERRAQLARQHCRPSSRATATACARSA